MTYQSNEITQLAWARTFQNTWPAFDTLEMPRAGYVHGVYVIWWGDEKRSQSLTAVSLGVASELSALAM